MICFAGCCRCILRIRIQINTVRNPQTFTRLHIPDKIIIILAGIVLTKTAADDGKVYFTRCFNCIPVDAPLMFTYVNTHLITAGWIYVRRKCRCDIAEEQHRHCHKNKNKSDYFLHSFVPFSFIIVVSKAFSNEKCIQIYSICFQRMCQYNGHFCTQKELWKPTVLFVLLLYFSTMGVDVSRPRIALAVLSTRHLSPPRI